MKKYEIVLKNEKEKTYSVISWLLLISNLISIVILTIPLHFTRWGPFILAGLAIAFALIPLYFKNRYEKIALGFAFFFFSLAWFFSPYGWLCIPNLLFSILDPISRRKLCVQFYNEKVIYPAIISKKILWNEISNVILKDGILTIDLKNNKIIQQEIDESIIPVNEKEFNEFCRQQLGTSNQQQTS